MIILVYNGNLSQVQTVWKMTAKLIMAIDYYITKWQQVGVGDKNIA